MPHGKGRAHWKWSGERKYDRDGYVWVAAPEHPRAHYGRYLEHRLVMEDILGRRLLRTEHVHHKNGKRDDNRVENLELLTDSAHAREHKLGKSQGPMPEAQRRKIAAGHLGKPKASRGRKLTGVALESALRNIAKARAAMANKRSLL